MALVVAAVILAGVAMLIVSDQWAGSSAAVTGDAVSNSAPPDSVPASNRAGISSETPAKAPKSENKLPGSADNDPARASKSSGRQSAESAEINQAFDSESPESQATPNATTGSEPDHAADGTSRPNDVDPPQGTETIRAEGDVRTVDNRLTIPTDEELRDAEKLIDELFAEEIKAAKTPDDKGRVAAKLLAQATQTNDNAAGRYRLLVLARELAIAGDNWATASTAIEQQTTLYQVSAHELRAAALTELARSRSSTLDRDQLAQAALVAIDQAVAADDYESAKRIVGAAKLLTRQSDVAALKEQVGDVSESVNRYGREFRTIKDAVETLDRDPTNKNAATRVGKFRCLIKGDWTTGLPLLARGEDTSWTALAAADLANPSDADGRVELADQWWETANNLPMSLKTQALNRAAHWYRQSNDGLDDLTTARVEKRLSEILSKQEPSPRRTINRTAPRTLAARIYACVDDQFVLAVNGKQVLEGGLAQLRELDYEFHAGDVVTVRAIDVGGSRGFSCVLKFADAGAWIATVPGGVWREYEPRSADDWSNVQGITQLRPCSAGQRGAERFTGQASGVQAGTIWGSKPTCYLALEIPK